jgi:CRISPR system Cascade subunit CasD
MPTLLLRCAAPLQAWDTQSNFGVRTTGREPTKSGIIGLLCAALGRPRSEPVDDLAALRMGVRVDQEGEVLRDWHTAGKDGYLKASGAIERTNLITSTRYYLTDAAFLVGLESNDRALLETLYAALRHPRWLLFLGRKACPPAMPVYLPDGFQDVDLYTALKNYHWLGLDRYCWKERGKEDQRARVQNHYQRVQENNPGGLRVVLEDREAGESVRNDQPISFEKGNRHFAPRRVTTTFIPWPEFEKSEVS